MAGLPAFNLADLYAYVGLGCLAAELWWIHREMKGLGPRDRWRKARETRAESLAFVVRACRFRR